MIRKAMWVAVASDAGEDVGIVFSLGFQTVLMDGEEVEIPTAVVHLTDEDGATIESAVVPTEQLRQATLGEIPAGRRPTKKDGAVLGYV
jgi:hypothetical protein